VEGALAPLRCAGPLDGASDRERYLESLDVLRGLDFDLLVPSLATTDQPYYEFIAGRGRASHRRDPRAGAARRERLIANDREAETPAAGRRLTLPAHWPPRSSFACEVSISAAPVRRTYATTTEEVDQP
jgi:hypothetical protein